MREWYSDSLAVRETLDKIGDQTSLATLANEASKLWRGYCVEPIDPKLACSVRLKWRKENRIKRDNRTYTGQPLRNMLKHTGLIGRLWLEQQQAMERIMTELDQFMEERIKNRTVC